MTFQYFYRNKFRVLSFNIFIIIFNIELYLILNNENLISYFNVTKKVTNCYFLKLLTNNYK